jgi:hypothetical protein
METPIIETVIEQVFETVIEPVVEPVVETVIETIVEPVDPMVIQNSDTLYKSDIEWTKDISYIEPNAFEIEMLSHTKTAKQLIDEESSEVPILKTDEEIRKQKTKDFLLMFKVIALARIGLHPLLNTSTLQPDKLKDVLSVMNSLVVEYDKGLELEIRTEFNKICIDKLFHTPDVSSYPVYS